MARGKKTPTAVKKLQGNYRSNESLDNEMQPEIKNELAKPTTLVNPYADEIWMKLTRELSKINMLNEIDQELMLAYCNEMGIYFDCCKNAKEKGYTEHNKANGEIVASWMKTGNTALNNAIKLSDKFGFNPAARTKIEMPAQKNKDPLKDI